MAQHKRPMSFEEFKKSSLKTISKNLNHPRSPYDPKTMKPFSTAPIVNESTTQQSHNQISKTSKTQKTPSITPKDQFKRKRSKKVDRSRTFVDSDLSDVECNLTPEDGHLSSSSLFGNVPPKSSSTPSSTTTEELEKAKTEISDLKKICAEMKEQIVDLQKAKGRKKKIKVTNKTKRRVPKCIDRSIEYDGYQWDLSNGKSPFYDENKRLSDHVVVSVLGLYPDMDEEEIKESIRINFRSKKDQQRRLEKNPNYLLDSAKSGRKDTKLSNRIMALTKLNLDKQTKKAISDILVRPLMSSEDEEIENETKSFVVRKPVWRTPGVSNCFLVLDEAYKKNQSRNSRFRCLPRKEGPPSNREEPDWSDEMRKAIDFFND